MLGFGQQVGVEQVIGTLGPNADGYSVVMYVKRTSLTTWAGGARVSPDPGGGFVGGSSGALSTRMNALESARNWGASLAKEWGIGGGGVGMPVALIAIGAAIALFFWWKG